MADKRTEESSQSEDVRTGGSKRLDVNVGRDLEIEGDVVGGDKIAGDKLVAGRDITQIRGERVQYIAQQVFVVEAAARDIEDLPPEAGEPAFKGLQYFDERDAALFFGREQLTADLIRRLHTTQFLAVVGASGSGKSSLVRAGVVPALKRGERLVDGSLPPAGSRHWLVHVLTPTARPLEALAASLTRESESVAAVSNLEQALRAESDALRLAARHRLARREADHLLLVVDQFEELFTLCSDRAERVAFIDNLLAAVDADTGSVVTIILTLRADFYAHCAQYETLRQWLAERQLFIGSMSREELFRAVVEPAARGEWKIQEGLVELMLDDVADEPGALPLLSHALLETWKRRRGRTMTLSGYAEAGGVRGAIAQTAESVYRDWLNPQQQPIARAVFLRLTELGEESRATRRRVFFEELVTDTADAAAVEAVLKILADARLVTTDRVQPSGREVVEVAHEAVIREWPTLRAWLEADREDLRFHRLLTQDAGRWLQLDRDAGMLYRGARLAQAVEWMARHPGELNALEQEFVDAGLEALEQEEKHKEAIRRRELEQARALAQAQQRRIRAIRQALVVVGILMLVAVATAFYALDQRSAAVNNLDEAVQQRIDAEVARANAVDARQDADTARATAVFNEQLALTRQAEAERLVRELRAVQFAREAEQALTRDPELARLLAIEAVKVTYQADQTVLPQAKTALYKALLAPRLKHRFQAHRDLTTFARFTPQGDLLVTAGWDGAVKVWNVETGRVIRTMRADPSPIRMAVLSPDGTFVLAITSEDKPPELWDVRAGIQTASFAGHTDYIQTAAFSPDGAWLVTTSSDQTARLWDVETGRQKHLLEGHTEWVAGAAFSPDGRVLVTYSGDKQVRFWDVATGALQNSLALEDLPGAVAFSPDGALLAAGSDEVRLWDVETGTLRAVLEGHRFRAVDLSFSPDGRYLVSSSSDHIVRLWDVQTGSLHRLLQGHTDFVSGATFSPDGSFLATAASDETVRLWDVESGALMTTLVSEGGTFRSIAFHPDGTLLAGGDDSGRLYVWDLAAKDLVRRLEAHTDAVNTTSFTADGQRVATAGEDAAAYIWNGTTGDLLQSFTDEHWRGINQVLFNSQGTLLATAGEDGRVAVWWLEIGELFGVFRKATTDEFKIGYNPDGTSPIKFAALSPTDRLLATISDDGTAFLWDIATHDLLAQQGDSFSPFFSLAFSPDGSFLVLGGRDGRLQLLDTATAETSGDFVPGGDLVALNYSPNGRYLAAGDRNGLILIWDTTTRQSTHTLSGHTDEITAVAFSPDSARVVSTSLDGTARLWDVAGGRLQKVLDEHRAAVRMARFSQDGTLLVTASDDRTAVLWDVETGTSINRYAGHEGAVTAAAFSPDGTRLVTTSVDGTARLWRVYNDIEAMLVEAQNEVRRGFTEVECQRYFGVETAACSG